MAPGLSSRQTGTVPKNKPRSSGSQSHRSLQESLMQSNSFEWEPVLDQSRRPRAYCKISSTHSEAEADSIRYDLVTTLPSAMTSQIRYEDNDIEGSNSDIHARMRMNIPDKKQVINKITQIQDYIQQTATLMNALKSSDYPENKDQYEELSAVLDDLKDSEAKLNEMLKKIEATESRTEDVLSTLENYQGDGNNSSDNNEEDLIRRSEESKKKLEFLQKRKQELIDLQEKARRQLQEAQMEQSRLVARASTLNQDINSNRFLDLSVQQLSQRLKNAQHLYKTSNQINESLADNKEVNIEEAEHPDEDEVEVSDTETDFQIVSDKVAELNAMKAQLSQIQKIMANIGLDSGSKEGTLTPTEMSDERRDQSSSGQRSSRNDTILDESCSNALKLEQAKQKLNQLTQLLEVAQATQNTKGLPSGFMQLSSNEEGASARRTPSPSCSSKSYHRPGEDSYLETMQLITRELEERAAAMKEEHERLITVRHENMLRKPQVVKPERSSFSPDDSGSEAPCLTNVTVDSSGRDIDYRLGNTVMRSEQQSTCNERNPHACKGGHSKSRHRGAWNTFVPSSSIATQEKKCKNEEISRTLNQISVTQNSLPRDQSRWNPSPSITFCDGTSCSAVQGQIHMDKSHNLCGRMFSDAMQTTKPEELTVEELYAQHQMLARTVSQCSQLLWLQQKQIMELRNTLMLQQSTLCQNVLSQPSFGNQPQRTVPLSQHSFQFNNVPNFPFPTLSHPSQTSVHQPEQNCLSPNQGIKPNSGVMHNVQSSQEFTDQFYDHGANANLPVTIHDVPECDCRCMNYNRSNPQHINSNSNANQNLNQNGASGLNNRIPMGGMNCLGPEDSGALNNQIPPGNRANNYWDNFRSYSRQNLLSHSKSNEDTEMTRRSSTSVNQERPLRETPSIMIHNNVPVTPSHDATAPASSGFGAIDGSLYEEGGCTIASTSSSTLRANHQAQVSRSRSVEIQNHRSSVKNESRNQENDARNLNPKNEVSNSSISRNRTRNPETQMENIRSVRNDMNQSSNRNCDVNNCNNNNHNNNSCNANSRNFVQLVRGLENDEGRHGINKKRVDKSGSRYEGSGNLNNRSNSNSGLPVVLRDNVYSEVTNFIRANENHPHFIIQLFRDLQQVTTDSLRQRTMDLIHETLNANNLTEQQRGSNMMGLNLNIIDNRNNIRENRSNLNRNQSEEPTRLDDLVENQNMIRQSVVGIATVTGSGNLENPNISNLRNLGNSRNNLESEGLRGLQTYYEASLCNFWQNSALENPNLSNIRENLTRRGTGASDLENSNPKNLYLNMYDNMGRRNQDSSTLELPSQQLNAHSYRNSEQLCSNDYSQNSYRCANTTNEPPRPPNRQRPSPPAVRSQGAAANPRIEMRGDSHFVEKSPSTSRFTACLDRDNYENVTRDFCTNENDPEVENNFSNDARKNTCMDDACEDEQITKKKVISGSEEDDVEEARVTALCPFDWAPTAHGNKKYQNTPPSSSRSEASSAEDRNYSCPCVMCQRFKNGDLAEADQSRNEETSGTESNNGVFANAQNAEPEQAVSTEENQAGPANEEDEGRLFCTQNGSVCEIYCESFHGGVAYAESEVSLEFENSRSELEEMLLSPMRI